MNRIKKKIHQKIENAFNIKREIPIEKMYLQFYMRNPFKIKNWNCLQFYKRIPFKSFYLQFDMKNPFKIYSTRLQFYKRNPSKIFGKKINTEIWSQKYTLGPSSWRLFLKKVTLVLRFRKSLLQLPKLSKALLPQESCSTLFYTNVVITQDLLFNISENKKN